MTCPEIDLGEFGKRLREGLGGKRYPLSGTIELTERCNLDCAHCYINQPAGSRERRERELTAAQWKDVLDQIAAEGCLYLLITGGEPLLHPEFLEIYDYAKRKGFLIALFTNGTLITPEIADHLAEWQPRKMEVTLYGATAETYERVTGVPGSFQRCLAGIDLLHERRIPLSLKTMLMSLNVHEIDDMEAYAAGLGLEFRFDGVLRPRPDGSKKPADFRLPPSELVALEARNAQLVADWKEVMERFGRPKGLKTLYVCGAGLTSFYIAADGTLKLCTMSQGPGYSLKTGTFREGWLGYLWDQRRREVTKHFACLDCELSGLCAVCPDFAALENGDPESPVAYLCEIAQLRASYIRKPVASPVGYGGVKDAE